MIYISGGMLLVENYSKAINCDDARIINDKDAFDDKVGLGKS